MRPHTLITNMPPSHCGHRGKSLTISLHLSITFGCKVIIYQCYNNVILRKIDLNLICIFKVVQMDVFYKIKQNVGY